MRRDKLDGKKLQVRTNLPAAEQLTDAGEMPAPAGHPYGGPSVVVPPAGAAPHDVDATSGVSDRMFS